MRALREFLALCKRFAGNARAVAAVEFALILPIMFTVYIGSIEGSQLITVDRRLTLTTGALGDLIARQQNTTNAADVTAYMNLTAAMMRPQPTAKLKQIVSMVYIKAGVSKVVWSRAWGTGAVKRAVNSPFPFVASDKIYTLVTDGYVVTAETSFGYEPFTKLIFPNDIPLAHRNVYLPRFGKVITCADC